MANAYLIKCIMKKRGIIMGRDENITVFKDTERLCRENKQLAEALKRSVSGQKLILEGDSIESPERNIFTEQATVVVSQKRTFEAASGYKGNRVAVHNFASATNPGGGVKKGANAQEECLCRCSGLYLCLNTSEMWDGFYAPHRNAGDPIHNDDIIYTPEIVVFKTDEKTPKLMDEKDWYKVNMITCAAPNLRVHPSNPYNSGDGNETIAVKDSDLLAIHEKRLRRIFDIAVLNGNDTVILGAFGCGAFENNPEVVATASRNVIKDYLHAFRTIEYAIHCNPWDEHNYDIFARVLNRLG